MLKNGRVCERRPGARYITLTESAEIQHRGLVELETSDQELFQAVRRVMWESIVEDLDTTYEEWRRLAIRRQRRLSKIRAAMKRAGSI
jgi:hypothetical protein